MLPVLGFAKSKNPLSVAGLYVFLRKAGPPPKTRYRKQIFARFQHSHCQLLFVYTYPARGTGIRSAG